MGPGRGSEGKEGKSARQREAEGEESWGRREVGRSVWGRRAGEGEKLRMVGLMGGFVGEKAKKGREKQRPF